MKSTVLLFTLLLPPSLSVAQPCVGVGSDELVEQAIALVVGNHLVLVAEHAEFKEQARQKSWDAYVTTGFSVTDTFESGEAGPNAAFRVKIPLFDRAYQLKVSRARTELNRAVTTITKGFLTELENVCAQAVQLQELDTMRHFYRDRMKYRQQRVDEGLDEADTLWKETEKVQLVEHDWHREHSKLITFQRSIATEYGGSEWKQLRALLAEITK
ncbi:MAG: hypothetical protein WBM38_10900 [Arenicellales bacterium]